MDEITNEDRLQQWSQQAGCVGRVDPRMLEQQTLWERTMLIESDRRAVV